MSPGDFGKAVLSGTGVVGVSETKTAEANDAYGGR
jgi:hypothetical protein